MTDIPIRISLDNERIAEEIKKQIEDGIRKGAKDIQRGIEREAQQKIIDDGAVWRHELLEGFAGSNIKLGKSRVVKVENHSPHASYQEHGVSGTLRTRDTPHQYTDEKPPLRSLIPWVRSHIIGTGLQPWIEDDSDE